MFSFHSLFLFPHTLRIIVSQKTPSKFLFFFKARREAPYIYSCNPFIGEEYIKIYS